jgi:hypothetical protein
MANKILGFEGLTIAFSSSCSDPFVPTHPGSSQSCSKLISEAASITRIFEERPFTTGL